MCINNIVSSCVNYMNLLGVFYLIDMLCENSVNVEHSQQAIVDGSTPGGNTRSQYTSWDGLDLYFW